MSQEANKGEQKGASAEDYRREIGKRLPGCNDIEALKRVLTILVLNN